MNVEGGPTWQGLEAVIEATGADELMLTGQIHDHEARLHSFELLASVRDGLGRKEPEAAVSSTMP